MPRRVEDIVKVERRSVREAPPAKVTAPKSRNKVSSDSEVEQEIGDMRPRRSASTTKSAPREQEPEIEVKINRMKFMPPPPPPERKKRPPIKLGRSIWLVSVAAVVLVVVASAYVASTYFSRATFSLYPLVVPVEANNITLVANSTSTPGYLRYEVKKITLIASTTIPASDGQFISTKAVGGVNVYNSYSNLPQRLIAGTRLISPAGRIYRLTSSVVIPGYTTSPGGSVTPGVVKAEITADSAGTEYNLSRVDDDRLTVLLYKDTARYETIYVKPRTDIAGGFLGKKKTIDPRLMASTTENMKIGLLASLKEARQGEIPNGYMSFDNAYTVTFGTPVTGGQSPNSAIVTMTGNLYMVVFKQNELIAKLAGTEKMSRLGSSQYTIEGLDNIVFTITNIATFAPQRGSALIAKIKGSIKLVSVIPADEIKAKLAGLALVDTRAVLTRYSTSIDITKSEGELFPSWASAVPKDLARINIVINKP